MSIRILKLLYNINHSYKKRNKYFEITYSDIVLDLCCFLKTLGIIKKYEIFKKTRFHKSKISYKFFIRVNLHEFYVDRSSLPVLIYSAEIKNILAPDSKPMFKPYSSLKIISTPSRIHSVSSYHIKKSLNISEIRVFLTNQGFLTDFQCSRLNIGGKLICKFNL